MTKFFFIVRVVMLLPITKYFTYLCPKNIIPTIGCRVVVPFGNRKLIGIIVSIKNIDNIIKSKFKVIYSVIDKHPIYNKRLWKFLELSSMYYHCSVGYILFHILPVFIKEGKSSLSIMVYKWSITQQGKKIDITLFRKSPRQLYTLLILRKGSIYKNELRKYNISYYALKQLKEKKLCYLHPVFQKYDWTKNILLKSCNFKLNRQEINVIKDIFSRYDIFKAWLLIGMNELSKIKIYIKLILKFLNKGLQVLIIVPHVNVIYQTISFLQIYFNVPIEGFHSNLTHYKKISIWFRAKNYENAIIVGTKKAIFIPFYKLGIIIVDEEHNIDYKNKTGWLYNARDLSLLRAAQENIPIILESISPTLETLHNVVKKKLTCVYLTHKVQMQNNIMQQIIDVKSNKLKGGLSISLINKIYQHIYQNNIILLIVNNNFVYFILSCRNCNKIASCVKCNEYYVFNKYYEELFCAFCITKLKLSQYCFYCGSCKLVIKKFDIKFAKECLKNIFLDIPVLDANERKNNYENILNGNHLQKIYKKSVILLIQEKDLCNINFLNIDLVGLLSIDSYLTSMNFRIIEKFTQFYTNLINKLNVNNKFIEVLIQTAYPDHAYLKLLIQKDYLSLSRILLHERKITNLPPFTYHAFVIVQSMNYNNIENFFYSFKKVINNKKKYHKNNLWMMGPFPDLYASSIKHKYYIYKLLLQDSSRRSLHILLTSTTEIINTFPISKKVKWKLDIDPIDVNK